MLAVDWLGLLLTAGVLLVLLGGRLRLLRVLAAILLGELGRAAAVMLAGGTLVSLTVGGAFTRMQLVGLPYALVQIGGLLGAAGIGRLFSRRMAGDLLLFAAVTVGAVLLYRR